MEHTEPAVTTQPLPADTLNLDIYKVVKNNSTGISPEGYYFPDEEYERLLTTDAIHNALGAGHEVSSLVNYALSDAKKTFSTVLQVFSDCKDRQEIMNYLMACGFSDTLLASQKLDESYLKHKLWNEITIDDFKTKRMPFIVPMFDVNIFKYEFENDRILPFRAFDGSQTPSSNGHFSEVRCVEMLASKQNKIKVPDRTFKVALKKLKSIDDRSYEINREWEREARAHEQLNGKSDNIIEAFGAYRQIAKSSQNDAYHLVLEWADGGSLLDFWKLHPTPQVNHSDVNKSRRRIKDMIEQIYGLSGALMAMHSTKAQSAESCTSESTLPFKAHPPRSSIDGEDRPLEVRKQSKDSTYVSTFTEDFAMDRTVPAISFSSDPASLDANTDSDTQNWRHGDIKPENILRFIDSEHSDRLGTLKLADLGRAQQHRFVTALRRTKENELWRTRWYEPPDLETNNHKNADGKVSRLFDVWSIGCVIFESALWLLYGCENKFVNTGSSATGENGGTPYWRKERTGRYNLTDTVTLWINRILSRVHESSGAIGDLVKLVRDRLLKIDLPPDSDSYKAGFRTNAKDLREQLSKIVERVENDKEYLFSSTGIRDPSQHKPMDPASNSPSQSSVSLLSVDGSWSVGFSGATGWSTSIAKQRVYTNLMKNEWEIIPEDTKIIESFRSGPQFTFSLPELCPDCEAIDILSHTRMSFDMKILTTNSRGEKCDLCELIYHAAYDQGLMSRSKISLKKLGNNLVLEENGQKFLRLIGKH